jgi:ankyrin repeat protein
MAKRNDKCPCGSDKKYKKCCQSKGLFTKKSGDLPSLWKNLGESDPSLRFAVGDRVEVQGGEVDDNGDKKWTPGTIRHLHQVASNGTRCPYACLLDYPVNGGRLKRVSSDTNFCVRPLGFTKSVINYQECGKCGVHGSVEGVVLLNCSGCRRIRYCCIEHLHADRKNHKAFCRAIIKENERYKMEINEIIKTGKAEAVNNALVDAALGDNLLVIKKLFKKRGDDIDVNALNSRGATALYNSSFLGHIGITTFLLEIKGIDVNMPVSGATALHLASQNGHVATVTMLLGAEGIKVNKSDLEGATPLYMASQNNQIEIVKLLLGAEGIEINQPTNDGATPLYVASQNNHIEIVRLLLGAEGIEANHPMNDGNTPLYVASQEGHVEIVKVLVGAKGIEINQTMNAGCTPLFVASFKGHVEIVKILLGVEGIKVNKSKDGAIPLVFASRMNRVEIVKLLLGVDGIELNQRTDGATALTMAKQQKHTEIVRLLTVAGATE